MALTIGKRCKEIGMPRIQYAFRDDENNIAGADSTAACPLCQIFAAQTGDCAKFLPHGIGYQEHALTELGLVLTREHFGVAC